MKTGLTRGAVVGIVLVATAILSAATFPGCPITRNARARYRVLCEADHRALVAAGRDILAEVSKGNVKYGAYSVRDGCLSNGVRLPQAIADIQPYKVHVLGEGFLRIELGLFTHFGVIVFPIGYHGAIPESAYGNRKLVDGLWYFDDRYKWPEYAEEIENMLRKCGRQNGGKLGGDRGSSI